MSIRIFRNASILGAQRFLESDTAKAGGSIKRVVSGGILNQRNGDAVCLEGLSTGNRSLKVTIENLNAADSTIQGTDIAKKIAVLTRDYILETEHQSPWKNKPT